MTNLIQSAVEYQEALLRYGVESELWVSGDKSMIIVNHHDEEERQIFTFDPNAPYTMVERSIAKMDGLLLRLEREKNKSKNIEPQAKLTESKPWT